ncbi:hypothetical protein SELMODRAFT_426337 [Selaginella moellendorffii]|uniref:ABC transporter domain-containing protein n=1 Tax=Selaginella moellendorffii TaxID=88036 RepID=D8SW25_SELML|nr:hypothetical protein SELMODRAFT_426337 [Selaginella moellendorffii]
MQPCKPLLLLFVLIRLTVAAAHSLDVRSVLEASDGSTSIGFSVVHRDAPRSKLRDEKLALELDSESSPTHRDAAFKDVIQYVQARQARLDVEHKQRIVQTIIGIGEEDNELFLSKLRDRIDRALPTLWNTTLNWIEVLTHLPVSDVSQICMLQSILDMVRLVPTRKRSLTVLNNISGIIKPSRITLLLGPPGSGRTTFLLALSGKLRDDLKVTGSVTYNGHELHEFVPQRTASYTSQNDVHLGELTVRETFDFSSRCQEMLSELAKRERAAGIKPDPDIDAFMKASAIQGQRTSIVSNYVLKILGLNICRDCGE